MQNSRKNFWEISCLKNCRNNTEQISELIAILETFEIEVHLKFVKISIIYCKNKMAFNRI